MDEDLRDCFVFLVKPEVFIKGGVGKFEKPARDTLVIFHGMLLTSR